jgi:hypothetical protein
MGEFEVGQLAQELSLGYSAYHAVSHALDRPEIADATVAALVASNRGPASVPTADIRRRDGTLIVYHLTHAIQEIRTTSSFRETYDRLWLAGALLTLGDRLADEGYFDQGPDLEFVRHLRNGIAHGNQFNLLHGEPRRAAHFTGPERRALPDGRVTRFGDVTTFEITPALQGRPVLFDFIGPGDVCDLFQFVSWRLIRIGNGDPPHPLFPQRP